MPMMQGQMQRQQQRGQQQQQPAAAAQKAAPTPFPASRGGGCRGVDSSSKTSCGRS